MHLICSLSRISSTFLRASQTCIDHKEGCTALLRLSWWRHQMETFSALLAICAGIQRFPVNSLHKGQWRGALMFSLICVWINGWENNREAGDLRRYRAHYDVIVFWFIDVTDTVRKSSVRYKQTRFIFVIMDAYSIESSSFECCIVCVGVGSHGG